MIILRPAIPHDAADIAAVHVACWREAYPGLVPDAVLEALDPSRRTDMWRAAIPRGRVFVATDGIEVVGFVDSGPQRHAGLPFDAEIYALYVLRRAQWRGLGRRLMKSAAIDLRRDGLASLSLWVLDGNAPARRFYEALGGRVRATRAEQHPAWTARETAYGWDDLAGLCADAPPSPAART